MTIILYERLGYSAYETDWIKQFGSPQWDQGGQIALDSTNNIYLTGYTGGSLDNNNNAGGSDVFVAKYDSAGNKIWIKQFGTTEGECGYGIGCDKVGNIYITGYTTGILTGNGIIGDYNSFLVKYDNNGNLLWTRQYDFSNSDKWDLGRALVVDSLGNIYITGEYLDTNSVQGYLAKYDSAGNQLWLKSFGTTRDENVYGMAIDSNDSILITGYTAGYIGTDNGSNAGYQDVFLLKYDISGNLIWGRQFGSMFDDVGNAVTADTTGNVYITGSTKGALDGNGHTGSSVYTDLFLTKYDSDGNRQWTRELGTASFDHGYDVVCDSDGSVYLTGETIGTFEGLSTHGWIEAFLLKYDTNGNKLWSSLPTCDQGGKGTGIGLDRAGNLYIAGYTEGDLEGINSGRADIFLLKIKSGRNFSIAGRIADRNGIGISDISVHLIGAPEKTMLTDSNGYYTFEELLPLEDYSVVPSKDSYFFDPGSRICLSLDTSITNYNFIGMKASSYAFPNPCKNKNISICIVSDFNDPCFEVDIINLSGEVVASFNNDKIDTSNKPVYYVNQWDCTNNYGELLASGIYVYKIIIKDKTTGQETKLKGKFAIIK